MSEKLPRITAAEVIRMVEKCGFFLTRQSGKHKIYKNKVDSQKGGDEWKREFYQNKK